MDWYSRQSIFCLYLPSCLFHSTADPISAINACSIIGHACYIEFYILVLHRKPMPFLQPMCGRSAMPYHTLKDLPDNVTNVLPKHAQEIYRAAFNNAWDEYKDPDERRGHASREETAHKVAWAAVKKEYEKDGDEWRKKKS
jgi:cation transport regulator